MFTEITYQDWLKAPDRRAMLGEIAAQYKRSQEFRDALEALDYFRAENRAVMKKTVLKARTYEVTDGEGRQKKQMRQEAIPGTRIASRFFFKFVTQENQYLLGNGVTLASGEMKERLGPGFDHALQRLGEWALIEGVSWGYWNWDHLEVIPAARDALSGFVALPDEKTGQPRLGIQFWQADPRRPQYLRLFEEDGVTLYCLEAGTPREMEKKRPYLLRSVTDGAGERVLAGGNYGMLPVIPLYANSDGRSELTPAIKSKIDAYDRILSDFGDNLERANDVYWVLNNFGGTTDEIAEMIEQINRLKVIANVSDGTGNASTAALQTFQVPYQARQAALDLLRRALYQDAMALCMDELTGGSLTNVAIRAAMTDLNLKCDRFEWQAFAFVQSVLRLLGVESERIAFNRQDIVNRSEIVGDIEKMRGDIDRATALRLNPYLAPEDVEALLGKAKTDPEAPAEA